jgi:hypothetical protein
MYQKPEREVHFGSVHTDSFAPPPPPASSAGHPFGSLPAGWTTVCDPRDGRLYYWNANTGQTSWTHPYASTPLPHQADTRAGLGFFSIFDQRRPSFFRQRQQELLPPSDDQVENPLHASRRPDSHECYAFTALILCAPIGIIACYHSIQVNRKWGHGRYGEAVNHARQAPKYAFFGVALASFFGRTFSRFVSRAKSLIGSGRIGISTSSLTTSGCIISLVVSNNSEVDAIVQKENCLLVSPVSPRKLALCREIPE